MSETLVMGQTAHLLGMSVFDIGGNKPHINTGFMASQISSLKKEFSSFDKKITSIAIPGFLIDLISENDPEFLAQIKSLVKENNLDVLAVPYYNSFLPLLSLEELSTQISLQEKIVSKTFGKPCSAFLCSHGVIPPDAEKVLNKKYSSIIYPDNALYASVDNPKFTLSKTKMTLMGDDYLAPLSSNNSLMEAHLLSELKNIYPFISSLGDIDSLNSWRFMSQPSMILKAGVDTFSNDAYEHYMHMMNTLNDLAHKITTVNLAKKGLFQEKPTISDSPSSILSSQA